MAPVVRWNAAEVIVDLDSLCDELEHCVACDALAQARPDLQERAEHAIGRGAAILAGTDAAEAIVANQQPAGARRPIEARDLLLTARLVRRALEAPD